MVNQLTNFIEEPKVKVELELTEQSMLRIVILAIIITTVVFALLMIYKKLY